MSNAVDVASRMSWVSPFLNLYQLGMEAAATVDFCQGHNHLTLRKIIENVVNILHDLLFLESQADAPAIGGHLVVNAVIQNSVKQDGEFFKVDFS